MSLFLKEVAKMYYHVVLLIAVSGVSAKPIVIEESSPSGSAVIAISSSDPNVQKYFSQKYPSDSGGAPNPEFKVNPEDLFQRTFSFASPGIASSGSGRSFVSTSAFSPFFLPFFNMPISFEPFGIHNFGNPNNWMRGIESFYEPSYNGNGEVKTVTAVNDNGHIYGKVNSVSFDNRAKST